MPDHDVHLHDVMCGVMSCRVISCVAVMGPLYMYMVMGVNARLSVHNAIYTMLV